MGSFSITHWLFIALVWATIGYPISLILKRVGVSPLWSLISVVPALNIIALWVFATTKWPIDKTDDQGVGG